MKTKANKKNSLIIAEQRSNEDKSFEILCYQENGDIYSVKLKDNLLGAARFNRILAQIQKSNPH